MTQQPHQPSNLAARRAYWQALGQFLDMFATVEATLFFALSHYAKTPPNTARAIFSGVRVDTATSFLRRIMEVENISLDLAADLKSALDQLHIINKVRNDLVHYGALSVSDNADVMIVTNALLALTKDRLHTTPVSVQILDDLVADLHKIQAHLVTRHVGWGPNESGFVDVVMPERGRLLSISWRYKSPPQSHGRSRTP